MKNKHGGGPWFDTPTIFAEWLYRSELIGPIMSELATALTTVPLALARWLRPRIHTTGSGDPPRVVPVQRGQWSGGVIQEHSESSLALSLSQI